MEKAINDAIGMLIPFVFLGFFLSIIIVLIKKYSREILLRIFGGGFSKGRSGKDYKRKSYRDSVSFGERVGREVFGTSKPECDRDRHSEAQKGPEDRNYSEELMDRGEAYVARSHLMSPTERDVYKVLEKAYGDRYYIMCQVRVVDLIQPNISKYHKSSKEFLSLFRQISQWHFDYVLCHREDFKFFCALELDDPSHERPDRVKRDRIINRVCKEAGLRLERIEINHKERKIEAAKDVF
ncbi:DUF2726 domain-containing protein [Halomonas salinarum]|uniref:DUF2726 domain-containing protein n=1 Tax=Halomonas salinarum TaxID=1158993 RepID=UPI00143C316A|nr:DUF2726 domain-containing protein [Halomonas salinarum]